MFDDIVCALSGILPGDDEMMVDMPPTTKWIPAGWIRVTVERKYPNPQWVRLQGVKQSLIEATLQQIPEEHREAQRDNVEIQVDAQYHQLEQSEKYKPTVTEKDVSYISPPEADEEIMEEYIGLLETLGLDSYLEEEEEGGEEEQKAEEEAEENPEEAEEVPAG